MKRSRLILSPAIIVLMALLIPRVSLAGQLVNGDFEDTTDWGLIGDLLGPPGWVVKGAEPIVNPVGQQSGVNAIGGSGTSALFTTAQGGGIVQAFNETSPSWELSFDIATQDPGGSGDRCLSAAISRLGASVDPEGEPETFALITYRINGNGDFQVYERDGQGWYTPTGLAGAIVFDSDVQSLPLLVNQVSIAGNFDEATPNYDITVINSNNAVFQATGLSSWNKYQEVAPVTGDGIDELLFTASSISGNYLLDNVVLTGIPDPDVPGDANRDGKVDGSDVTILAGNWQVGVGGVGGATWDMGDFNGDGAVDGSDVTILAGNWQAGVTTAATSVPEPSMIVLLLGILAALVTIRRVKK